MQTAQSKQSETDNTLYIQRQVERIIRGRVGREQSITDIGICGMMGKSEKFERTVRRAVTAMRKKGVPICSESGRGYWWPINIEDTRSTAAELRSRAVDMFDTATSFERGAIALFGGQESF